MRPTRTELALLISMLGAGLSARAQAGELTMADLCSVPTEAGCVERDALSGRAVPQRPPMVTPVVVAAPPAAVLLPPSREAAAASPARTRPRAAVAERAAPFLHAASAEEDAGAPADTPPPTDIDVDSGRSWKADAQQASLTVAAPLPEVVAVEPRQEPEIDRRAPAPPPKDESAHALVPQNEGPRQAARRTQTSPASSLDATPPDPPADAAEPVRASAPVPVPPPRDAHAFVANHVDKVLLNLLAVTSLADVRDLMDRPSEQIVVGASHADRVMSALAGVLAEFEPPAGVDLPLPLDGLDDRPLDIDLSLAAPDEPEPLARPVPEPVQARAPGDGWVAVNEHELDAMRGGFTADNGLKISFGIERAVYINGNLVTATSLNVAAAGGSAAAGTPAAAIANSGTLALIRNGAGNTLVSGTVPPGSMGTVIQNTLNDQKIQNLTVINATVNSLEILRGMNVQSALRSAVIDSLRR